MPGDLNNRVDRLEKRSRGELTRFLVVHLCDGESREDAIKRAGVESVDNDAILFLTRISRDPGDDLPNQDGEVECRGI